MQTPEKIVQQMLDKDAFSAWLQLELLEIKPGRCVLRMKIRLEMLNGFQIAHGGITYALCDSALAFASNAMGEKALSIETSISHIRPSFAGEVITATAEKKHHGKTIGIYHVEVRNQDDKIVALFKGIVHSKNTDTKSN